VNGVHFVMQGKGGVGKSYSAYHLAQYFISRDPDTSCFDTDPLNPTLLRYKRLNTKFIQIADQEAQIHIDKFDELVDHIAGTEHDVVIDTGGPTFLPISKYLIDYGVFEILTRDYNKTVVIHVVISAKTENDLHATVAGLDAIANQFPSHIYLVVWLNEYTAPIKTADGLTFEELPVYIKHKDRIHSLIRIPKTDELTLKDINAVLNARLTFDEALASPDIRLMAKSRLRKMRDYLYAQMEENFTF
jgi:hypothetical protein